MTDIKRRVLEVEEIEPEDDRPKVGQWYEYEVYEDLDADAEPDADASDWAIEHAINDHFHDADGPVVSRVRLMSDEDEPDEDEPDEDEPDEDEPDEDEPDEDDLDIHGRPMPDDQLDVEAEPERPERYRVTRRVLVCVTHVGSNYAAIKAVSGASWRVLLTEFRGECTRVHDEDARIAQGVAFWQRQMADASKSVAALMGEVGLAGRQIAPATQALAVSLGNKAMEDYKAELAVVKVKLPGLFTRMEVSGKQMGKWMAARAIPLRASAKGLKETIASIDSRLLAVDLYAGLSETPEQIRSGDPAGYGEPLHVLQGLRYMDEECIAHYQVGGITFDKIDAFDRWVSSSEHFERLFPFVRCVVAFRVRRKDHDYPETHPFVRMILRNRDKKTFLLVRNGDQLFRLETAIDFGPELFPDRDLSVFNMGDKLWATRGGDLMTDAQHDAWLEDQSSRLPRRWRGRDCDNYEPLDDQNLYYDDIQAIIARDVEASNRVAVLIQGLWDRSAVLHPHPPIKMWDHESFARSVRLVYDNDRVITAGEAPDFKAYQEKLRQSIGVGSWTIGQEREWRRQELDVWNRKHGDSRYERNSWYPSRDNPGPGHIAQVVQHRGGKSTFAWQRLSLKRERRGSRLVERMIQATIAVGNKDLFNVSAYVPGDFKRFFADIRTRQNYMKWAHLMLAAEEFHAGRLDGRPPKPESVSEPEDEDEDAS